MFRWDPTTYLTYAGERGRPFADLVGRVEADAPARVLDLGCGDGGFTAGLAQRWPGALVEGVDSSPEMIERAQAHATASLSFRVADVRAVPATPDYDVVLSNAMFQWVPDHADIFGAWAAALLAGAWFAVQLPGNFEAPSHRLMRSLAASPAWSNRLPADLLGHHDTVRQPSEYAQIFLDAGWTVDAWETTYAHPLDGDDPVLDWVRGTSLRPVLAALAPADAAEFTEQYRALLREAYPRGPHGTVFEFRRNFVVAHRV